MSQSVASFQVPPDHNAVDKSEVVDSCKNAKPQDIIFAAGRIQVVRLKNFVIKCGRVTREEAENQNHAHALLDPSIILVPKVYCYFNEAGIDYLVMDHITGEHRSKIEDAATIKLIARAAAHLHRLTRDTPGPVCSAKLVGTLWPQDEDVRAESREHLELLVQSRLRERKFILGNSPLVFIHGDIRLHNILFTSKGICLLDWEFAAYLPRSAEIATLRQSYAETVDDLHFRDLLDEEMLIKAPLTEDEKRQTDAFLEYAFNNIAYAWNTTIPPGKKKDKKKQREEHQKILKQVMLLASDHSHDASKPSQQSD